MKMTNFPRMMAALNDARNNLDHVNLLLNSMADDHMIEPIDDPENMVDFWDWADVVGVVDEYCPADEEFYVECPW
jgi:hypothetical protein